MADETAEVRVRLVLDDAASGVANKLNSALGSGGQLSDSLNKQLEETVTHGTIMAHVYEKAFDLMREGAHKVGEQITESFHAAVEEAEAIKDLAGVIASTDSSGSGFGKIQAAAFAIHDELEQMGIQAGVSADQMQKSFDSIALRSNKSLEEVEKLTYAMAGVSKAVPGGMNALSEGFSAIELGVIRARNPVVQLIASTQTLHGNAKEVAAQMMKMTPEKQMEVAEEAIQKMAVRVKDMPQSFGQVTQSLKDIKNNLQEAVGGPMVDRMTGVLVRIKDYFGEHADQIEDYASRFGETLGDFIGGASDVMGEFFGVFNSQAGSDIADAISSSFDWARDQFGWIYDHRHELAAAFKDTLDMAVGTTKEIGKGLKEGASYLDDSLKGISHNVASLGWIRGIGMTAGGDTMMDGAMSTGAKARMLGKNALPSYQLNDDETDQITKLDKMAHDVNTPLKDIDQEFQVFTDMLKQHGFTLEEINATYGANLEVTKENAFEKVRDIQTAAIEQNAEAFVLAFNNAAKIHDEAAMQFAAKTLAHNKTLAMTLIYGGYELGDGYQSMIDMVRKMNPALAKELSALAKTGVGAGIKPTAPVTNFNGGQTFNIKQDFRDQDPDRVALVFRQDVLNAATNRTTARTATPFGL